MIYTRIGRYITDQINKKHISLLPSWSPHPGSIFYHQRYDQLNNNVTIKTSLDEVHWQYLSQDPTSKFIHENCIETFDATMVDDIVDVITKYNIKPSQFYFILADENHCNFLKEELEFKNIKGCNFDYYNTLLYRVNLPESYFAPTKKFSVLSRNYNNWRLNLYLELQRQSLLENFNYSFHNIKPYNDVDNIIPVEKMIEDTFGEKSNSVIDWIRGVPYNLSSEDNVSNKYSDFSYYAIMKSSINVLIETHFQPVTSRNYCAHITEKTYKNVVCRRPFLVFSTPGWLTDFQQLGYKSFSPYINEEYDSIKDNYQRLLALVAEVNRLNSLSDKEFRKTIKRCNEIVNWNYNLFVQRHSHSWSPEFKFLDQFK